MVDTETSFLREQQKQETKNVDSFYRLLKGIHGVAAKYCQSEDETVRTHGQDIIKSMECLINKQINIRLFYERVTRLINDDDDVVKQLRDPAVEKFIIDTFQTFYNHARRGEIKLEFNNYIIKMNDNLDNYADMECIRPLLDNILDSFTSLPRKTLSYFNVVVEVISVFETERASTVLRVWDGDLHKLSPNVFSADESIIATYCFERDPAYDSVQRNRYIDITLYGDHIRKAKTLWPGDIILISNLHFALPNNSNMQVFTLHSGTMGSYRRGIYHVPVSEMEFTALRLKTKETLEKLTKAKENMPMSSEAQALPNPIPKPLPQKVEGKPRSVDPAVIAIKNAQKAQVPAEKKRSSSTSAINNKSTTTTTVVDKPPEASTASRNEATTSTTTTAAKATTTTTSPSKTLPNKIIMKTSPASAPPSPMAPPQKKVSPAKAPTVAEHVRAQAPPTEVQKAPVKTTVSDPLPMGPPKRPPMSNSRKLALMKILEYEPDNNLPLWRPPTPEEPLMEDGLPLNHWSRTFVYVKEEWPPFTLERCLALAREAGLVWNPNEDKEKEEQEKKRKEEEARKKKLEEEEAERKRQELEEKAREEEAKKQKELEEKKRLQLEEAQIEAEKKKEEANKRKKDLEEKKKLELEEKKKKLEQKERETKRADEEKRVRQEERVRIVAEKKKRDGQQEDKIATRLQSESEQSQSSSSSVVILSEVPSTSKPPAPIVRVLPTRCKAPVTATQFSEDIFDTDGEEEDDEIISHTTKAGTSESVEIVEPPTRPTVEVQPRRRSNRLSGVNEPTPVVEPPKELSQDFEEPPAKRAKRGSDHRSNLLVIPKTSKSPVPPTVVIASSSSATTTTRQQVNNGDIEILEERLAPTEVNTFLLARIKPEVIVNNTRSLSTLSSRSRRSQHSPLSTRLNELSTEINCQTEVNNGGGGDNGAIDRMPKQQKEPKVAIHMEITQQERKVRVTNLSTLERQQQQQQQPPAHVATPPRSSPKKYNFRNPKQEKAIDYTPQLTIVSSDTNGSINIIRTTTSTNSTVSAASTETKPMTKTSAHPEKDQQSNQQQQPPVNVPPPVISPATKTVVPRKPGRYRENGRLVKKTNEPFVSSPPSKRPLARKMVAMPSFDPTRITRSGRRISPAYVTQPKKARLGRSSDRNIPKQQQISK